MSTAPDTPPVPAAGPPVVLPPEQTLAGLAAAAVPISWLWYGYLAPGNVTLLTSRWKAGKTTLVSVLLARLKAGGTLAGLPVAPARTVVVTEEPAARWVERSQHLDFGGAVSWMCRPFRTKPRMAEWLALIDRLAELRGRGFDLAVIDPLSEFLPGRNENSAGVMLEALLPLRRLTDAGMAVLLLHHPRRADSPAGCAGRGSGALLAYADILLEMYAYPHAAETDRRRRLVGCSRFDDTPRQLVIELNAEGTDYLCHGDFAADEFAADWQRLRPVLEAAQCKLTRRDVLNQWQEEGKRPAEATVWRWLQRAVDQGLLCQEGTGRRQDPFRYWLPDQPERWRDDPVAELLVRVQDAERAVFQSLEGRQPPAGF